MTQKMTKRASDNMYESMHNANKYYRAARTVLRAIKGLESRHDANYRSKYTVMEGVDELLTVAIADHGDFARSYIEQTRQPASNADQVGNYKEGLDDLAKFVKGKPGDATFNREFLALAKKQHNQLINLYKTSAVLNYILGDNDKARNAYNCVKMNNPLGSTPELGDLDQEGGAKVLDDLVREVSSSLHTSCYKQKRRK